MAINIPYNRDIIRIELAVFRTRFYALLIFIKEKRNTVNT
jgi:hypothetical protein